MRLQFYTTSRGAVRRAAALALPTENMAMTRRRTAALALPTEHDRAAAGLCSLGYR